MDKIKCDQTGFLQEVTAGFLGSRSFILHHLKSDILGSLGLGHKAAGQATFLIVLTPFTVDPGIFS